MSKKEIQRQAKLVSAAHFRLAAEEQRLQLIECDDPSKPWWATTEQTDAYRAEMAAEWAAELQAEDYESDHPESRCPPRE